MRKTVIFIILFCVVLTQFTPLKAGAEWDPPSALLASSVYFINSDTGTVVYQKNADQKVNPASITKLMTAILTVEKFKDSLGTVITIQNSDLKPLQGTGSSLMGLKAGEQFTVEQLLYGLLLPSGNDAALVLARAVGGDTTTFVGMMNQKATDLGCKSTHYVNPHGLTEDGQYTTAQDVFLIAKYAMSFDILSKVVSTMIYKINASATNQQHTLINTDTMLTAGDNYYKYVKGIKTGSTTAAGDCFVSYASNGGYTYYAVVMGSAPTDKYCTAAFVDTKVLYQWGFSNFEIMTLVDVGTPQYEIPLELAWNKSKLQLVADNKFNALIPVVSKKDPVTIVPQSDMPKTVMAPIVKGQKIGTANVMLGSAKVGTIDLVASENIERSKPLYFVYLVGKFFKSVWFKIVSVLLVVLLVFYLTVSFIYNRKKKKMLKRKKSKYGLMKK